MKEPPRTTRGSGDVPSSRPSPADVGIRAKRARRPLPDVAGEVERPERARALRREADRSRVEHAEDRVRRSRRLVAPRPQTAVVTPGRALPLHLGRQRPARPAAERRRVVPGDVGDRMELATRRGSSHRASGTGRAGRSRRRRGGTPRSSPGCARCESADRRPGGPAPRRGRVRCSPAGSLPIVKGPAGTAHHSIAVTSVAGSPAGRCATAAPRRGRRSARRPPGGCGGRSARPSSG